MLIRFEVENFRSILEPAELSLVAVDDERVEARPVENLGVSLVPVAGIFGPNASGKSNVLAALAWLQDAVESSLRDWGKEIPVEPFAFGPGRERDSSFAVELLVDGIRFEYLLDVGHHAVTYEALFHYPEGRRRRVFERDGEELKLQRGLGKLGGVRPLLGSRTLALSAMQKFDEPLTSGFYGALVPPVTSAAERSLRVAESQSLTAYLFNRPDTRAELAADERVDFGSEVMALLQLADLGVVDVEFPEDDDSSASSPDFPPIRLVHQLGGEKVAFDFSRESDGTRVWFKMVGPVVLALATGSFLRFDELDASLHPTLTAQLVRLFHDPKTNPLGAQLIFTSHDVTLLNHLNRDEVWLTTKGPDGATRLGALSDFAGERVRLSANLEKGYLSGRFGALPDVSNPDVLRELGLVG